MKIKIKPLALAILLPLLVGAGASFLSREGFSTFETVNKPPLTPPPYVFAVVWTLLYILMGISSYLVFVARKPQNQTDAALKIYGVSLLLNFIWPLLFFGLGAYLLSFFELLLLWVSVLLTILAYRKINASAAWLQVPYFLWVTFAAYLNFGVFLLNR